MGAIAAELCACVCADAAGRRFRILERTEFNALAPAGKARVYWREILFRVYVGAATQLARHWRWQRGCVLSFAEPANLLSFASNLRGLVESAFDAWWTFRIVAGSISRDHGLIEAALAGRATTFLLAPELEDRLIHFVYGRKLGRDERSKVPSSHLALEPKDYRSGAGLPLDEREAFQALYDELCGLCHPTAFSLTPTLRFGDDSLGVGAPQDRLMILRLCERYSGPVGTALSFGLTSPAVCLKLLNSFSLAEVASASLERWSFEDIPIWRKAMAAMADMVH